MSVSEKIKKSVKRIPKGKPFGYDMLRIEKREFTTAAKVLERMQKTGEIKKISKGVFYKPKSTVFGELKPEYDQLLNSYLFENGKRIAYETGTSLYNKMGLTTQMAFLIKVASSKRINVNRGTLKIKSVKSYIEVTNTNYTYLGILDAIKDIKKIPDSTISKSLKIISVNLQKLSSKEIDKTVKYAQKYPTRVRALLGAILENLEIHKGIEQLQKSLNPFTKINIGVDEVDLPNKNNWNII